MTKRILLVDDEPKILQALHRVLEQENSDWAICTSESVDEALSQIRSNGIDVVVTDIGMPGKDGFFLLKELASRDKIHWIPVIVVTGKDEDTLKSRALEMGAVDLLNKPIHPQDLLARIRNAIRLKEYEEHLQEQNRLLERKVAERTTELADSRLDIIWRLGKAAECRDENTGNHVVRVGLYSLIIAERMGLQRDFVEKLFLASPLHDIGKIGIPDDVLLKKTRLTEDETRIMRKHCEIGHRILSDKSIAMNTYLKWCGRVDDISDEDSGNLILTLAASIARTHHEWWDGSGYPEGLSGNAIPLPSRIVAVADTYDALRTERPYKPAISDSEAREVMEREAYSHFDPNIYDVFVRSAGEFRVVAEDLVDFQVCVAGNQNR